MEYISGPDLEQGLTRIDTAGQVIQGSPQPLEQILRDGIELCRILEYLARQSPPIVHHDIKPANLIRDAESHEVFLVDFGSVARPVAGQQGITIVYGTPGYAAPECYRGISDPRSDVYGPGGDPLPPVDR
ncbi:MAG: hypothetical protein KatS3mg057_3098 [Herpetosiphonaceae bacterium]|nr:MAG: hypothetical protein KatS3mg057_3098 [Herpetosiphonaceae bacterium]